MSIYCVFCKTGAESLTARYINEIYEGQLEAISPTRILKEKRSGRWYEVEKALLPGYIFIFTYDGVSLEEVSLNEGALNEVHQNGVSLDKTRLDDVRQLMSVYRILQYQNGVRSLTGSDWEYADWVYRNHGRIGPSKAIEEGGIIRIIDGPLMDNVGRIIKLDRHKRRAMVEFNFDGRTQVVSLSVEMMEFQDSLTA